VKVPLRVVVSVLATGVLQVRAATITVSSTEDSGPGTLRDALANTADGDTIDGSSVTGIVTLTSGELLVTNSVEITGPGSANLALDGNFTNRVLYIGTGTTVILSGVTIKNGLASQEPFPFESGGGLYIDHANMTISNCAFTGNSAGFAGGAIMHASADGGTSTLTIVNCTLSGNTAGAGAGLYDYAERFGNPTVTIRDSTFSGNSASRGAGIYVDGYFGVALVFIDSSTFSSNSATFGGGIYNDGAGFGQADLHIVNSTLSGNHAHMGGGIYSDGYLGDSRLEIMDSTMAKNSAQFGGGIFNNPVQGSFLMEIGNTVLKAGASGENIGIENNIMTITSRGYNICSDDGHGYLTATGDQINTDALLRPLEDNGGPTLTHALLCGSPAIDAGSNLVFSATDQRGLSRTVGTATDVGAFEVQGNGLPRARCRNVEVSAGIGCTAGASIDAGSTNPDRPCDQLLLSQNPPGPYGLGGTLVTLTVTDSSNQSDACTAMVTVFDDAAPSIDCPALQSVPATAPAGAIVDYPSAAANDNCSVLVACVPAPSTTFPVGDTAVTCTAADGSGNTNSCKFSIHVKGADEQLSDLLPTIAGAGLEAKLARILTGRLERIRNKIAKGKSDKACAQLAKFIAFAMKRAAKEKIPATVAELLTGDATRIRAVLACN
jgi:hypothetical protein